MYKFIYIYLLYVVIPVNSAMAEQSPVGFASDVRIKHYVYDERNVYKLNLYIKSVTAIQFAEGENVESILIGDSASWEVIRLKRGNVISLKPIIDKALTNMTVYTDQRVYTFEIRSVGQISAGMAAGADQAFRAVFTYPHELKAVGNSPAAVAPANHGYMVSGDARFRPLAVTDNMLQTTFVLPRGAPQPAIFKVDHDRVEKLVNSRSQGDRIIADGTSDYWVMRIGNDTVCVGKANAVHSAKPRWRGLVHDR
ncbi:TrbG/VirB9 family P-type conjugative transfer protein [Mesorhizobium sp.]|uniref:TrbG/VirB9 family P-type conjugative transfer protein n=1 Tax=Mesorhizobium sp. TaxID=1871066 RepID=UPI000FE76533|nr:TrbG/VirB9 family P-type conjugative transfer protein [Mesorhizobium sp.]RWQ13138.1 MAG: conjugal transfer protein [Mesorhizobium sp.]TIN73731.1 MAG: conjugal transfer protein [Mesorhizobium sp.]